MLFYEYNKPLTLEQRVARLQRAARNAYFWHVLKFDLRGGPGAADVDQTERLPHGAEILGGVTSLANARVALSLASGRNFSAGFVPVRSMFNYRGASFYTPLPAPIRIPVNESLSVRVENTGPDSDTGQFTLALFCRVPLETSDERLKRFVGPSERYIKDGNASGPFMLPLAVSFPDKAEPRTAGHHEPLLILGIASELSHASVIITPEWTGQAWSRSDVPVWAFAGDVKANGLTTYLFPEPLLLPANSTLATRWQNTGSESGGLVTFICCTP